MNIRGSLRRFGALLLAAMVLALALTPALAEAAEYYLTWEEYAAAHDLTESRNYNDFADGIDSIINHAIDLYAAGESAEAYEYAKATYWGYYETTGFERNVMTKVSGGRVSAVELQFSNFRKMIKKDKGVDAAVEAGQTLSSMLHEDAVILSGAAQTAAITIGLGMNDAAQTAAAAETVETAVQTAEQTAARENTSKGCFLTWEEYAAAYGYEGSRNYNDFADGIDTVINHAIALYAAGESAEAYEYAKATYWGYYETTGFERNVMTKVSGGRVSAVELQFSNFRKMIKKDKGVDAAIEAGQTLSAMLHEDAVILSGAAEYPAVAIGLYDETAPVTTVETPVEAEATAAPVDETSEETGEETTTQTGSRFGGWVVFGGAFGIILREGLEAILVVGAIIAYLIKSGNKDAVRPVYIGAAFAVVCSVIMAIVLNMLLAASARNAMTQEIIEGIAALLAVCVLFYVSNWMVSKAESEMWNRYIESKVASSAAKGSMFTLGFTAWLAVFREGAEVILFYQGMGNDGYPGMMWAGFLTGCVVLVVIFLAVRFLSVKLPLKPFFLGTSILMAIMTVCFLGSGIKELLEGTDIGTTYIMADGETLWDIGSNVGGVLDVLGIYPVFETLLPQIAMLLVEVATFAYQIGKGNGMKEAHQLEHGTKG